MIHFLAQQEQTLRQCENPVNGRAVTLWRKVLEQLHILQKISTFCLQATFRQLFKATVNRCSKPKWEHFVLREHEQEQNHFGSCSFIAIVKWPVGADRNTCMFGSDSPHTHAHQPRKDLSDMPPPYVLPALPHHHHWCTNPMEATRQRMSCWPLWPYYLVGIFWSNNSTQSHLISFYPQWKYRSMQWSLRNHSCLLTKESSKGQKNWDQPI